MSTSPLFDAFPPITSSAWQEALEKTLKGRPTSSLDWDTGEGFVLKPYYRKEDILSDNQTFAPERGSQFNRIDEGWQAVEEIPLGAADALQRLNGLAEAELHALYVYEQAGEGKHNLGDILEKIPLQQTALHLALAESPGLLAADLYMQLSVQRVKKELLTGTLTHDPIAKAMATGTSPSSVSMLEVETGITAFEASPWFRSAGLNLQYVADQGGNLTQQVAFALASTVAYLDFLEQSGSAVSRDQFLDNLAVTFPVGTSFPLEIAKFRAFRMLFAQLLEAYGVSDISTKQPFILSRISPWNYVNYDPHNNLLRATSGAMAAIIGGTQALSIPPFDVLKEGGNQTSARLARNIQHLLTHESYLNRVKDPAGGSYYIEQATLSLAEAAWAMFQQIEQEGGMLKAIEKDLITSLIQEAAAKKQQQMASQKRVQVGVNKYPNARESYPELDLADGDQRAAVPFEKLRQRTDAHAQATGTRLKAFLFLFGDVRMRNARSQFARNLWGVGGLEVVETQSPNDPEKSLQEALDSKADVIVLCSSDADAMEKGPALIQQLREGHPKGSIFLAGKPEGWESLGIEDAIFARMNVVDFLNGWLDKWIG